jgi:hypothetical protein
MQQVVSNGSFNYEAPRTAQGHSDRCTALALAVRAASFGGEYVPPPRVIVAARPAGGIVGAMRNMVSRRFG